MKTWLVVIAPVFDRQNDSMDIFKVEAETEEEVVAKAEQTLGYMQEALDDFIIHLQAHVGHYKDEMGNRVYIKQVSNIAVSSI